MKTLWQKIFGVRLFANETKTDPGTGKTVDFQKMLLALLGLNESANEEEVTTAYNTAMATDPDEDAKTIKAKVAGMEKANEDLQAKLKEKETLAANEAAAKKKAEDEKAALEKRATQAEGNFANERAARIKLIVGAAMKEGRITKAESENVEKLLANAKDFDAEVETLSKKGGALHTQSQTNDLGPGRNQGVKASEEFANEVGKAMKDNPKLTYDQAWKHVSGSEKGKSLLALMHQPQSAIPQKKAA